MKNRSVILFFLTIHNGALCADIKSLHDQGNKPASIADKLKSAWSKQSELIKDPTICSSLRNLLLYYPACISGDETSGKFFLSDSNHHRIIIFDRHGKIFDSIGCSPGFEDGEFDNTRLMRPVGSHYDASEGSLYFVDSEIFANRINAHRCGWMGMYLRTSVHTRGIAKNKARIQIGKAKKMTKRHRS